MAEKSLENGDKTLLSFFQKFTAYDALPTSPQPHSMHSFGPSSSNAPLSLLRSLVDASDVLNNALQAYSGSPISDHKAVSILRQSSTLIHNLHTSEHDTRKRIDALKARDKLEANLNYGEPILLDKSCIIDWIISRIEQWGEALGMEIFKDEEKNGHMTMVLGGKVLVIELDFIIRRATPTSLDSHISVAIVKSSHAIPSGTSGNSLAERSASLDEFILQTWNHYLEEVQHNEVESSMRAAHLSRDIQGNLAYLMKLDHIATLEGDQGIRWFNDIGLMSSIAEQVTKAEVDSVAKSYQGDFAPLDVFLSRAHALALPYLVAPTMSFLVYLSPPAYYSILRASRELKAQKLTSPNDSLSCLGKLDITPPVLRSELSLRSRRPAGATIATLILTSSSDLPLNFNSAEQTMHLGRPNFRLPGTSGLAVLDHNLPLPLSPDSSTGGSGLGASNTAKQNVWVLDFTDGGRSPGVVMTHTRMREIQQVIDPMMDDSMGFGMHLPPFPGSWLNLLVNPSGPPSERYIATYKSPSSAHPLLRLRLTAPNEAGFLLGRVPVRSLKEVWGVLEIVRDQCWLNETLNTVDWISENAAPNDYEDDGPGDSNTEEDLNAILNGTFQPRRVPVNVFLPYQPPTPTSAFHTIGSGLDSAGLGMGTDIGDMSDVPGFSSSSASSARTSPCMVMTVQTGGTNSAQLQITAAHDRARKQGVRVDVGGALPYTTQQVEELEEFSRRGAALGIAGKVWRWAMALG